VEKTDLGTRVVAMFLMIEGMEWEFIVNKGFFSETIHYQEK